VKTRTWAKITQRKTQPPTLFGKRTSTGTKITISPKNSKAVQEKKIVYKDF